MVIETNDFGQNEEGWGKNKEKAFSGKQPTFFSILSAPSILSQNNSITEIKGISDAIKEFLKEQKDVTSEQKSIGALPTLETMNAEQSPNLPGLILRTIMDKKVYIMPILFYKEGVSDVSDTIYLGANIPPFQSKKVAEAYMNQEIWTRVSNYFQRIGNEQMQAVIPLSCLVVDIDRYTCGRTGNTEDVVVSIRNDIVSEWFTALWNFTCKEAVATPGLDFPNPFKDQNLLGKDSTAIATVEAVPHGQLINSRPSGFNLSIRLATTNRNQGYNQFGQNPQNSKSISTTYCNVSLDCMSAQQYALIRNQTRVPMCVGPLVPVISVGPTIPGEQLRSQTSIMSQMLGVYSSVAANEPPYFSEAFRGADGGNRGTLANLAQFAYQAVGAAPTDNNMILTEKNMVNPNVVLHFINNYISARAIYAIDIPSFVDSPANNDLWWGLIRSKQTSDTIYYRTFMTVLNVLSNGNWAKVIEENKNKGNARTPLDWVYGDPIVNLTNIILPGGVAEGRNGRWIDLREADLMCLADKLYLGNKQPILQDYFANINGTTGQDVRIRQYNIKRILSADVFQGNVQVDSFYHRVTILDSFLSTFARAMNGSGNINVNSNGANFSSAWQFRDSNPYLNQVSSATISSSGMNGMGGGMGNTFTSWNR